MKPPASAPAPEARAIERGVATSLHRAFRVVSLISGGLALLASVCAAWGVRDEKLRKPAG